LEPQLVPLAPQHAVFSEGAQHDAWAVGEQQAAASAGCCVAIGMPLGEGVDGCLAGVVGWLDFIAQLLVSLLVWFAHRKAHIQRRRSCQKDAADLRGLRGWQALCLPMWWPRFLAQVSPAVCQTNNRSGLFSCYWWLFGADIKTASTASLFISLPTVLVGLVRYANRGAFTLKVHSKFPLDLKCTLRCTLLPKCTEYLFHEAKERKCDVNRYHNYHNPE
jgi:hypothetical protein